jgi:hypothetical protein
MPIWIVDYYGNDGKCSVAFSTYEKALAWVQRSVEDCVDVNGNNEWLDISEDKHKSDRWTNTAEGDIYIIETRLDQYDKSL